MAGEKMTEYEAQTDEEILHAPIHCDFCGHLIRGSVFIDESECDVACKTCAGRRDADV